MATGPARNDRSQPPCQPVSQEDDALPGMPLSSGQKWRPRSIEQVDAYCLHALTKVKRTL